MDGLRQYGMTTVALGVVGSSAELLVDRVCQFLLTNFVGYPLYSHPTFPTEFVTM